jgi:hypothetical protein
MSKKPGIILIYYFATKAFLSKININLYFVKSFCREQNMWLIIARVMEFIRHNIWYGCTKRNKSMGLMLVCILLLSLLTQLQIYCSNLFGCRTEIHALSYGSTLFGGPICSTMLIPREKKTKIVRVVRLS